MPLAAVKTEGRCRRPALHRPSVFPAAPSFESTIETRLNGGRSLVASQGHFLKSGSIQLEAHVCENVLWQSINKKRNEKCP